MLRDHAQQILQAVALDIKTRQNPAQQLDKSQGLADDDGSAEQSAASIHGALRHASNFSLVQLSAEFRALRATVPTDPEQPMPVPQQPATTGPGPDVAGLIAEVRRLAAAHPGEPATIRLLFPTDRASG